MALWDGRYLGEQVVLDVDALLSDEADGPAQIDGVPQDNGVDDEVEAAGAVGHSFGDTVPQLAELVQEDGASEGMAGFALIKVSMGAAAQERISPTKAARHVGLGRSTLYRELALIPGALPGVA